MKKCGHSGLISKGEGSRTSSSRPSHFPFRILFTWKRTFCPGRGNYLAVSECGFHWGEASDGNRGCDYSGFHYFQPAVCVPGSVLSVLKEVIVEVIVKIILKIFQIVGSKEFASFAKLKKL